MLREDDLARFKDLSTRSELKQRWHDLIDIDAGTIATGAATIE